MSSPKTSTRRSFLRNTTGVAAAAIGFPRFVPASILGRDGRVPPSERITMGFIGTGGKGRHNLQQFLAEKDVQVVALCDVDARHLEAARQQAGKVDAVVDFRELVAREDLDAVCISTPDHWHGLQTVAALRAGQDVYCEKPLANSVAESRAIRDVTAETKRMLQCGSHERSNDQGRRACELVRNGRIGELRTIRIQMPSDQDHHRKVMEQREIPPAAAVPEGLDYDLWLGHTAAREYRPFMADEPQRRCHFWWRFVLDFGGGEMTDRGAHIIDLAQLGGGFDATGPVEIDARGAKHENGIFDAFLDYRFENVYANGVRMIGVNEGPRGVRFEGSEGWIFLHVHGCRLEASDPKLLESEISPNEIHLGRSPGHHRDFLDAVKSRTPPVATAEIGHRTATICHLNNLSMRLGRALRWDPAAERLLDDDEATALLTPPMRAPWRL